MLTLEMVQAAREAIAPYVRRTRLEKNRTLSERLGTNVYLKLELFQRTGSFKPRGAVNQLLSLGEEARARGIVGVSGGNFAQGAAYAGRALGVRTRILMAQNTPRNYVEATRGYGAEVELVPGIAQAFARAETYREQGWSYMHPYANEAMMAGNGTLGLEIVEDLPEVTDVAISIGGGGLIAGVTTALKGLRPEVRVWGVETEGADVMARSLRVGHPVGMTPSSLARTLGAPDTSQLAFDIAREHVEKVQVVSDEAAYHALRFLLERAKLPVELAASCTLAAAEQLREGFEPDDHLVLVMCGGNVSLDDLCAFRGRFEA